MRIVKKKLLHRSTTAPTEEEKQYTYNVYNTQTSITIFVDIQQKTVN